MDQDQAWVIQGEPTVSVGAMGWAATIAILLICALKHA